MFFDMVILNPQHRGHFSNAWLAATRGVRFISKKTLKEIDIFTLCKQLADFIATSSKDPKKRFSLRLSAILLNGTVKIYREKVLLLEAEVVSAIQTIHVPDVIRRPSILSEEGPPETPPTPVAKVKSKRGKKQIVATPTVVEQVPEVQYLEDMLRLPEFEDILQLPPPATSDMITLRDEAPRRTEEFPMEEGFDILTGKELEIEIDSLLPRSRAEPVAPLTSSSPFTPPQVMEVVALVHADRGEFLDKVAKTPEVARAPRVPKAAKVPKTPEVSRAPEVEVEMVPDIEIAREVEAAIERPTPMEIVEVEAPAITVLEIQQPRPEIIAPEEEPIISVLREEPVLQEIQPPAEPVEILREKEARKVREPRRVVEAVSKKADRDKLFLGNKRTVYVRINRCAENEGQFIDQVRILPLAFRNAHNENFYNMFWSEEEVHGVGPEVRAGSSVRSTSLRASIGIGGTPGHLTRSTLDKDLTDSLGRPFSEVETPQKSQPSLGLGEVPLATEEQPRQLSIEVPPVPVQPTTREEQSVLEQEPLVMTIGEEPPVVMTVGEEPPVVMTIGEEPPVVMPIGEEPPVVQPTVPEELPVDVPPTVEVSVPMDTVQLTGEMQPELQEKMPRKETKRSKSPVADYKLRQQQIVDFVKEWNFGEKLLTIEDICQKPMNKMNMARAFHDVLVLCSKKYLILCTEDESLELKHIKKGPRLV